MRSGLTCSRQLRRRNYGGFARLVPAKVPGPQDCRSAWLARQELDLNRNEGTVGVLRRYTDRRPCKLPSAGPPISSHRYPGSAASPENPLIRGLLLSGYATPGAASPEEDGLDKGHSISAVQALDRTPGAPIRGHAGAPLHGHRQVVNDRLRVQADAHVETLARREHAPPAHVAA